MFDRKLLATLIVGAAAWTMADANSAHAQYSGSAVRSMRFATNNYLYNRPTVSPYLNLTYRNSSYGLSNYFTQVRPRVEAQQRQQSQQRTETQMRAQAQMNQVQEQMRQGAQQAASMVTTGRVGWSSRGYPRYGAYLSFYPGMNRIPRR